MSEPWRLASAVSPSWPDPRFEAQRTEKASEREPQWQLHGGLFRDVWLALGMPRFGRNAAPASCLVVTEVHRNRSWPSWARGTLVALASAMMTKSAPVTDDLPCDLLEFLAQRCGIEVERAAELVGDFLMQYEPASVALPSFASWRAA